MKWRVFALVLCLCGSRASKAQGQLTLLPDSPRPQPGIIVGTVVDVNEDAVPGATVVLESPVLREPRTIVSNGNGFFKFNDLEPGTTYHVTINAQGFASWTSSDITLKPSQYVILKIDKLHIAEAFTTIIYLRYYFKIKKSITTVALRKDIKADYSFINSYHPIALENTIVKVYKKLLITLIS